MATKRPPSYRLHKPSGQAVVTIDGKDRYLGRHGTRASRTEYRRLIEQWHEDRRRLASVAAELTPYPLTVSELILAYWERHVVSYYVKNDRPTSEQGNIRQALRFLRNLHGRTLARDFGPIALMAVRDTMVEAGRCRRLINKDVHRIRAMFRWAARFEMYPGGRLDALLAVTALEKGRSAAKERPPVRPVPEDLVLATLPHLSPQVAAMVRLQLLTAARPGEVMAIHPRDVDRCDPACWTYRPASHKTEHHDRDRVIMIGPRAQEVLGPWLDRDPGAYCFCPFEVVAALRPGRTSKGGSGKRPAARPQPGGRYSANSYRVAIARACRRAGLQEWTPHQIRHTAATAIRSRYDTEAAQIILGHSKPDTTMIYAARDLARARRVMAEIG
jgi:integrase